MNVQDSCYRQLFSHHILFQALAGALLSNRLSHRRRLDQAQSVSPAYAGPDLQNRQADLIWSIPARNPEHKPIVLLVEHQSRPDPDMLLRLLAYTVLHYQALQRASRQCTTALPCLALPCLALPCLGYCPSSCTAANAPGPCRFVFRT